MSSGLSYLGDFVAMVREANSVEFKEKNEEHIQLRSVLISIRTMVETLLYRNVFIITLTKTFAPL